uniref:Outer dense fiber protein 3-like n=1 Tax=Cyanistes caeruleus TaxID=156563 RepID=A0A8C0V039_CYACU
MEGPWVGNWRPHTRRGPILAEFATPGPKYWLPGTTGHAAHDPTKYRAPAYSFRGTKCPAEYSCSPGPRYYIHPSITKTGKHEAPSAQMTSRPKTKIEVTPGPSDYTTDPANKHIYQTAQANSLKSRPKDIKGFQTPGPATYTLPRILGPHTAYTRAEPCYSLKGKSQYQSAFQDFARTPGPAAFNRVELDVYKTRAPKYTMGLRTKLAGKDGVPSPAEYTLGKVRQPCHQHVMLDSLHLSSTLETEASSSTLFFLFFPSS